MVLLVLLSVGLAAQKANMALHFGSATATDKSDYQSNTRFGGGLSYQFYVNKNFSLGLEAFYLGFRFEGADSTVNILPIQGVAAARLPVSENLEFYGGSGGGLFVERYKSRFDLAEVELLWGLTPRAGLVYEFAQDVSLDVHAQYAITLTESTADDVNGILSFNLGLAYNIFASF
ncbi:MAG: outer membrane beta-barrel protein [Owenweeksia sp.]|nr:outer membrane beta-barrel protein [Owenweeksia sp.]